MAVTTTEELRSTKDRRDADCPGCDQGLKIIDTYGRFNVRFPGDFIKSGDIYQCENEDCDSQAHNGHFHTRGNSDELNEGYPC